MSLGVRDQLRASVSESIDFPEPSNPWMWVLLLLIILAFAVIYFMLKFLRNNQDDFS